MLKDRVQLQAKFYDSRGNGVAFGAGYGPDGKLGGVVEITGPRHPRLTLHIAPLFKYPSDRYIGKYVDRKPYNSEEFGFVADSLRCQRQPGCSWIWRQVAQRARRCYCISCFPGGSAPAREQVMAAAVLAYWRAARN